MSLLTLAGSITLYNRTVEEGKSATFECDLNATSPFYYYRYFSKYIHPPVVVVDTKEEYPWAAYAINASNSLTNLQTIPKFVERSEDSLTISNFAVEFHNNLVCCQGYSASGRQHDQLMATSLSTMTCYHVNVQCKIYRYIRLYLDNIIASYCYVRSYVRS